MTGTGRKRTAVSLASDKPGALARVDYRPPGPYAQNLEVMSLSDLRHRVSAEHLHAPQRIEFHLLMAVTGGRCTHWVDFVANDCRAGSWIVVRPGQVQRFDPRPRWDGRILMFRSQFLLPLGSLARRADMAKSGGLEELPSHLALGSPEHRIALNCIEQMGADCRLPGPDAERQALLRHQLHSLLLRLRLVQREQVPPVVASANSLRRFNRFREAVEADFARLHQVRDYAGRLGYSEKSLTRSTVELAGVSAKAYLSQRIALEAKRLLVHTSQSVSEIAIQLGMDEPSNFVKFFKREVGSTPTAFRQQQG